jgi:hypothetical protein
MQPIRGLTIGKLASLSGVNPETIRYYERIGLMPAPDRTEGGHRLSRPRADVDLWEVGSALVFSGTPLRSTEGATSMETMEHSARRPVDLPEGEPTAET